MTKKPHISLFASRLLTMIALLQLSIVAFADSHEYQQLQNQYIRLGKALQNNVFNEPMHLTSSFENDIAEGEIFAVIKNEFSFVAKKLITAEQWCEMLALHINVKGCYVTSKGGEENGREQSTSNHIILFAGRNYYQQIEDAYVMNYTLRSATLAENYVKTTLMADSGPFGTSDYVLAFEAIPVSSNSTFMHFKYSYRYGFMASLALGGYLATLGRNKVGFSIEKYDETKKPVFVKGMQGIVERNSMRYFLAIRAYLDTTGKSQDSWNARINRWYNLALPYKRQLSEVDNKEYLSTKEEEAEKRVGLEEALAIINDF